MERGSVYRGHVTGFPWMRLIFRHGDWLCIGGEHRTLTETIIHEKSVLISEIFIE